MPLTGFFPEHQIERSIKDPDLDPLMQLAGKICDCPYVFLSLKESSRVLAWSEDSDFFSKARIAPEIRAEFPFHADAPVVTRDGRHLGVLSVLDRKSGNLSEAARQHLQVLAGQVARLLSHRASEEELRRVIQRQRLVVDAIPAMIAYWDSDERCHFANKAYFEWFGFTPERLYGLTMKELLGETLYERNSPYIRGAQKGIPQFFERELTRKLQGDLRHTQAHYIPDVTHGEVRGFFVLVADVTDRKHAEMEAVQAREVAVSALKVKTRFLANMSHEIRSPLNGMIGMLTLALDTLLTGEQKEYLVAAKQSADHLLTIINDILDFSKIEAGKMVIRDEIFSLRAMVRSSLSALLISAERKGISTEISIDERIPESVKGDSVRLRQVLLNIFGNAVKFTSVGRITLKVFLENEKDQLVHFEVTDTGIGIPAEKLGLIFSPFRQADEPKAQSFGGTGLGLAISKELVGMMGGEIEVQSEPGRGSKFHFKVRLPSVDFKI